ncbi:hypothetical protein AMTRI_Chr05g61940 [Amborella trichopoda]
MTLFEQVFQLSPNLLIGQYRRPVTSLGQTAPCVSSIECSKMVQAFNQIAKLNQMQSLKAKFLVATAQSRATTLTLASTSFALVYDYFEAEALLGARVLAVVASCSLAEGFFFQAL